MTFPRSLSHRPQTGSSTFSWRVGGPPVRRPRLSLLVVLLFAGELLGWSLDAAGAPLIDCVSSDNGDPQITAVSVSPAVVDVTRRRQRVTIEATARDTGGPGPASGLQTVGLSLAHHDDDLQRLTLQQAAPGRWVGSVTVPRYSRQGRWRLYQAWTRDVVGQEVLYGGDEDALPFNASFRVVSTGDATRPRLTAFTFAPHAVDTTRRTRYVRFTARARDGETGVASVVVAVRSRATGRIASATLTRKPGTAHVYQGRAAIPRRIRSSRWRVWFVTVNDRAGKSAIRSTSSCWSVWTIRRPGRYDGGRGVMTAAVDVRAVATATGMTVSWRARPSTPH